jgi:hypothetical protein
VLNVASACVSRCGAVREALPGLDERRHGIALKRSPDRHPYRSDPVFGPGEKRLFQYPKMLAHDERVAPHRSGSWCGMDDLQRRNQRLPKHFTRMYRSRTILEHLIHH